MVKCTICFGLGFLAFPAACIGLWALSMWRLNQIDELKEPPLPDWNS